MKFTLPEIPIEFHHKIDAKLAEDFRNDNSKKYVSDFSYNLREFRRIVRGEGIRKNITYCYLVLFLQHFW